ncbi:MAG: hypothetical protein JXR83_09370 [Deltaproteobacteria bacterium]|nr:hypothetical protein [Deltaproteobacteria bacterium]
MPKVSSQDYAIRLLQDLDQVTRIPPRQRLEVLQSLIAFARQIRSLPLPGELRGRIGVHTMNAIFAVAEHDPASAKALRALVDRVTSERGLGSNAVGISSSMPWPNPLATSRRPAADGSRPIASGDPTVSRRADDRLRSDDDRLRSDDDRLRSDDDRLRSDDAQRLAMLEEQRRMMLEDERRRMMEDQRRRMMEDEERRRRDADRYR